MSASPPTPSSLPYRSGVGVVLFNAAGQVFVGRRIDQTQDAWQMPQGGIDDGESARDAALRELAEEIGTANVEILAETADWLTYDLPPALLGVAWKGKYRGQRQKWFAARFLGTDSDINLDTHHPEFDAWRWLAFDDLPAQAVAFKRDLYEAVTREFATLAREIARQGSGADA